MSKTIGLFLSIWMCLFFTTKTIANSAEVRVTKNSFFKTELREDFFQEQIPEVTYGKPYNLVQCGGPASQDPATFYLVDAVRGVGLNANGKDSDGVDIVPFGFLYEFYSSHSDAEIQRDKIPSDKLWISLPQGSASVSYYVRVYSVADPREFKVQGFDLEVKKDDCTISDMIVSVADLYKTVSASGQSAVFNLAPNANQAFLGNVALFDVALFKVVNGAASEQISDQNGQWLAYSATNNTKIEIQVKDRNDASKKVGVKQFTLYTEYLDILDKVELIAQQSNSSVELDKREGVFDLNDIRAIVSDSLTAPFLEFSFYSDKAQTKKIDSIEDYTALDGSVVYAKVNNLLFQAQPINYKTVEVKLSIEAKPVIGAFDNLMECSDRLTQWRFDLLTLNKAILADYPAASADGTTGYQVGYFATEQDAIDNTNEISNSLDVGLNEIKTVWLRLTDLETGNFNHTSFTASLGYSEILTYSHSLNYCFVDISDSTVNLNAGSNAIKGVNVEDRPDSEFYPSNDLLQVFFYENQSDAENSVNALTTEQALNYPLALGQTKTIYTRVSMLEGFACKAQDYKTFTISSNLGVTGGFGPVQNTLQLCGNEQDPSTINTQIWFEPTPGSSQSYKVTLFKMTSDGLGISQGYKVGSSIEELTFDVTQDGDYYLFVVYENNPYPGVSACDLRSSIWKIKPSFTAIVLNADATNMINSFDVDQYGQAFVEIGVSTEQSDDFEYAIDNGAFQPYNRFDNIPIGDHVAWVRSKYSNCAVMTVFSVFGYPKFFTPNGDGYNDTWNIPGLSGHPEAKINIFDRNGKLLKQMSPNNMQGWDGLYNGRELPSSDYWFSVEFTNDLPGNDELNGRSVKYTGHFSLKR